VTNSGDIRSSLLRYGINLYRFETTIRLIFRSAQLTQVSEERLSRKEQLRKRTRCRPGPNVIKLFTSENYEFSKVRVLVPGKLFQLIVMFASKAEGYSSGAPFKDSTIRVFY